MPINELLQSAIDACAGMSTKNGDAIKAALEKEIRKLADDVQTNLVNVIKLEGMGWLYPQKHAVMLAHSTFGYRTTANLINIKPIVDSWMATDLNAELDAVYQAWLDGKKAVEALKTRASGTVFLAPSFRHANKLERITAFEAMHSACNMLFNARLAVDVVPRNQNFCMEYETWFGTYDTTNAEFNFHYPKVKSNIAALFAAFCTKPIRLYYRGSKIKGIEDKAEDRGAPIQSNAVASAYANLPDRYGDDFHHITFGKKMYSRRGTGAEPSDAFKAARSVFGPPKAGLSSPGKLIKTQRGDNTVGGTIIHELSHQICQTKDEPNALGGKSYGETKCKHLANNDKKKACNNADNYKYYCQLFQ